MGNCQPRVDSSVLVDENFSKLDFGNEILDNISYDYNDSGLELSAPCHSCNLLDESSLPFFLLASILGILASGTVLFALFRPLFHWQHCADRPVLAQLAVGSALFSIVLPILAPGLRGADSDPLCHMALLIWYGSAFAQALLIGCRACLGPKLGAGRVPRLTVMLTVGLWGAAVLLGLPITLAGGNSEGLCTISRGWGPLQAVHTAACFAIFIVLPLGLLGAKGLKKALDRGPCPWVDVLWAWFIFWWPHGVLLGLDSLVRSRVLLLSTCTAQQALDLLLHLAEALAILHCVATPLLLALSCHQATSNVLPSLPVPVGQSSHPNTLGGKS
ncbi:PREDICTED: atypical chemokine receptor 1 [Condylura cristata]|uniref:atypical chemokine receptor 1 n=1 Tax=Condylura cristata TaxID=143302 RepID=UPI00064316FA|nr:PREDICTED: atypical chemokine receptor 1 [Condylura cristata]